MFFPEMVFRRARKEPFQRTGSCFADVFLTLPLRRENGGKTWVPFYGGLFCSGRSSGPFSRCFPDSGSRVMVAVKV